MENLDKNITDIIDELIGWEISDIISIVYTKTFVKLTKPAIYNYLNKNKKQKKKPKLKQRKIPKVDYNTYINSQEWEKKRKKKLKLQKYKCEVCNKQAWQVHHKNYKRLGKERMMDLQALCGSCHMDIHNIDTKLDIEYKNIVK